MFPEICEGYTNDWYDPLEPVIPRVYHEKMSEEFKENVYSKALLEVDKAYFTAQPDQYKVFNYSGAAAVLVQTPIQKAPLLPGSKDTNQVKDYIYVRNGGYKSIYTRVHLAIPDILDDNKPTFDASSNLLHFNADKATGLAIGEWSWAKEANDGRAAGAFIGSSGWNFYNIEIGGIKYAVYCVTRETALEPGKVTADVIHQCYLDAKATPHDIELVYNELKTNKWDIKVAVEAVEVPEDAADPFTLFNSICAPGSKNLFE